MQGKVCNHYLVSFCHSHSRRAILFKEGEIAEPTWKNNQELVKVVPKDTDWRIYEHCAVVTRL